MASLTCKTPTAVGPAVFAEAEENAFMVLPIHVADRFEDPVLERGTTATNLAGSDVAVEADGEVVALPR